MRKKIFIYIIMPILFFSCHSLGITEKGNRKEKDKKSTSFFDSFTKEEKKELTPIEYVRWVEDKKNGLRITHQEGAFFYELQYQPLEYLVVMQERTEQIEASLLKEEMDKRGDLQYFKLKMYTEKGKGLLSRDELNIENKELYLLSGLQQEMMLLQAGDTLRCVMFHFESSNNLVPYDQCMLAFEEPSDSKTDILFIYRTNKYENGGVRIPIKRENINRIPQLKTM
jgi:regulatory protein YycI of two-component signal transduction system YycFG